MWIKRKGCEAVNLEYVQSIDTNVNDKSFCIKFYEIGDNVVTYYFATEKEFNEYYEALMDKIEAEEIVISSIKL